MDFGGYTSLRGFFGSAEKKAQRVQDLQYAQNLMTAQQNDAIREMQYRTSQQNLINEADKAEYLIHEVFVGLDFDPKRMTDETVKNVEDYHTRPEEVAKLAQLAEVKSLILNHVVPPVFDESKLKETIAEFYKGDIFVGEDLMEFKLL